MRKPWLTPTRFSTRHAWFSRTISHALGGSRKCIGCLTSNDLRKRMSERGLQSSSWLHLGLRQIQHTVPIPRLSVFLSEPQSRTGWHPSPSFIFRRRAVSDHPPPHDLIDVLSIVPDKFHSWRAAGWSRGADSVGNDVVQWHCRHRGIGQSLRGVKINFSTRVQNHGSYRCAAIAFPVTQYLTKFLFLLDTLATNGGER
jgi:hypothetical protein